MLLWDFSTWVCYEILIHVLRNISPQRPNIGLTSQEMTLCGKGTRGSIDPDLSAL